MADTIAIELITNDQIREKYPFWNKFPLLDYIYKKGKEPIILHADLIIDTSTENTPTESTKPTNEVFNFTTPVQVYLRSDVAGDKSKEIDVIGEKSDGSFGQFTLTSDDTDGTTAVDCGTWNFIAFVIKNDTWAGNVILDDDGVSSKVYWTCALGATATSGILVIPTGYNGALLSGVAALTDIPADQANGNGIAIAKSWYDLLIYQRPKAEPSDYGYVLDSGDRVDLKHFFKTAVSDMRIDLYIVLWT
jgi:hypothetical protein